MKVHTIQEYWDLCEPLTDDEYEILKNSIIENGLREPIVVNKEGVVLDGHHRFKICVNNGIKLKYIIQEFPDKLAEQYYVLTSNLERKNLNKFRSIDSLLNGEDILRKNAKEKEHRRKTGLSSEKESSIQVDSLIANLVGKHTSQTTVWKVRVIRKTFPRTDPIYEDLRHEKVSIAFAHQKAIRKDDHANPPKLPEGEFDVILADPPWTYEFTARGTAQDHYQTMTLEDICNMKVPSATHSILFLWGTMSKLEEALKVVRAWGFKYRTHAVWIKPNIGNGYYFRGQHELLLVGRKGQDLPIPETEDRPSSVIVAPSGKHSEKPEKVYEIIEQMYPNRKYLELFARNKREGWTSWGDEV